MKHVRWLVPFFVFFGAFFSDRMSKMWILKNLHSTSLDITSFLRFRLIFNKGISWSLLNFDNHYAQYILMIGIVCLLFWFGFITYKQALEKNNIVFHVLVLAGGCSNLWDRFQFGAVVDFIELYGASWSWPIFNGADIIISVGMIGVFFNLLRWR